MNAKPLEITISDSSVIYTGTEAQTGVRRAELSPANNDQNKGLMSGKKTVHFSLQYDTRRLLNYTHEYLLFFMETSDYATTQISVRTGAILGGTNEQQTVKQVLRVFGNTKHSAQGQLLFETGFVNGWHNFALELDFNKNTVLPYYSSNEDVLEPMSSGPISNSLGGGGRYHFGLLKKGTNGRGNFLTNGFQPRGINEGMIYGGIFVEDGALDCSTSTGSSGSSNPGGSPTSTGSTSSPTFGGSGVGK